MHSLLDRSVCCSWRDNPSISMYCHWRHLYAQMSNALGQNVNNKALPQVRFESNTYVLERFNTLEKSLSRKILLKLNLSDHSDEVLKSKEFQRSFRHSDTECLSRSDEVLKLKNFKKDASLKLSSYQIKKDLYDSWKSRMELYMQNREHRRMILESVEHGPLIWPTVEENSVIRTKKYAELSAAEKIQADCDIKATNIILQGLPADIYSLVNHDRVAKDLWERVQLLMQCTSLTKQERECKLYNAFDKFTHIKGESLHMYYLRFTQLINDMNIYKMKNGSTIQVITKSLTVFHLNGVSL
ncbi:hypothetical protein Tco_1122206 [Tanacetum coccineum]|uniref:Integrase, catalytic region, zinc finger, CCHC-type, peptidase aspartic, catalytic n=1 Tax=Tanacetum coccineum TaxID=301880 RepID=A0ABQ5J0D9_9ASTR